MRRTTVLAACLLAAGLAVPAHASEPPCCIPPPIVQKILDSVTPTTSLTKVRITLTGAYTGVLANGLQVAATCVAAAEGAVSAVVIDQCYLTSNGVQHPSTAPGNASASAFAEQVDTLDFTLCYHAYAVPMLDPLHPATASGCATPPVESPALGDVVGTGIATGAN